MLTADATLSEHRWSEFAFRRDARWELVGSDRRPAQVAPITIAPVRARFARSSCQTANLFNQPSLVQPQLRGLAARCARGLLVRSALF